MLRCGNNASGKLRRALQIFAIGSQGSTIVAHSCQGGPADAPRRDPAALLLLLGSAGTTAQALPAPPPAGAGDLVVIHAGTLLDRPGRPPRRNASILVRGNRIEAVQDGLVAPPAGRG